MIEFVACPSPWLIDFIAQERPASIDPWVDAQTRSRVEAAMDEVGGELVKPVFQHLNGSGAPAFDASGAPLPGQIGFETIRIVAAFRQRAGG